MHRSTIKLAVAGLAFSQSSTAAPYKHDSDLAGLIRSSHLAERSDLPLYEALYPAFSGIYDDEPETGDCSPFELDTGLVSATGPHVEPDTPESFLESNAWDELSNNATQPDGYYLAFSDLQTLAIADLGGDESFLGVSFPEIYDPKNCSSRCSEIESCNVFNIAVARMPSLNVDSDNCPNPPSLSQYVCTYVHHEPKDILHTDEGNFLADFHVVYAGSNVYSKLDATNDEDQDSTNEDIAISGPLSKRDCNKAPIVINADFEVDDPSTTVIPTGWNITNVSPAVAFGFTKPGSTNNGGTYAFLANMLAPDPSAEDPHAGFALSQVMNTCAGTRYNASFDYRFDDPANGQCGLAVFVDSTDGSDPRIMYYTTSGDYEDTKPHTWISVKPLIFTAKRPDEVLSIMVDCSGLVWNNYSIDNVYVESIPKNDE